MQVLQKRTTKSNIVFSRSHGRNSFFNSNFCVDQIQPVKIIAEIGRKIERIASVRGSFPRFSQVCFQILKWHFWVFCVSLLCSTYFINSGLCVVMKIGKKYRYYGNKFKEIASERLRLQMRNFPTIQRKFTSSNQFKYLF